MARQVRIYDSRINFDVVHRPIKYPRLEFKTGELLLVLPKKCDNDDSIIEKHKDWIYKKNSQIQTALKEAKGKRLDLARTDEEFRDLTMSLVKAASDELKIGINTVYFRKMKSKWGSCSAKKNLTINTLMKHLPEKLIKYVIFHEMIHLIERKHNERFWKFIDNRFENYEENEKNLLVYWVLMQKTDLYSTYFSPQWGQTLSR